MSEYRKIAESLRSCALGMTGQNCRRCVSFEKKNCSRELKLAGADAIDALLKENGGPMRASAPTEKEGGALWKTLRVGERVWFLWFDDDACEWEIGQELVTGVGYKGFWYSGCLNDPLSAEAFVGWDRVGVDVFFTGEAAEERRRAANE